MSVGMTHCVVTICGTHDALRQKGDNLRHFWQNLSDPAEIPATAQKISQGA